MHKVSNRVILTGVLIIAGLVLFAWLGIKAGNEQAKQPALNSGNHVIAALAEKAGASPNWLAQIQAQISAEEYHVKAGQEEILQAPNRKQNLRLRFDRKGVELRPREQSAVPGPALQKTFPLFWELEVLLANRVFWTARSNETRGESTTPGQRRAGGIYAQGHKRMVYQ